MSQPSIYSASGSTLRSVLSTRFRPALSLRRNPLRHSLKRIRSLPLLCNALRRTVKRPFKFVKMKTRKHPVKIVTRRSVPLSQNAVGGVQREVDQLVSHKEPLSVEISLLPPSVSTQAEPLAKSCFKVICPARLRVECHRLPGAEVHHFGLRITTARKPVTLILPWNFCGVISLRNTAARSLRVSHTAAVADLFNQGRLRFGGPVADNEDEIELENPGSLKLYLLRRDGGLPPARWFIRRLRFTRTVQFH
ncbi:hypothetical protein OF83DRAFT_25129 [Amylostereum chailletii]|nr:hypothetical protein OF83DRAFT_25129 [Amylostereum chailletii]